MRRFVGFCMKVKLVAVELTTLVGFLMFLGWALYWECSRLFHSVPK